jgi:alanine dehydrogenase
MVFNGFGCGPFGREQSPFSFLADYHRHMRYIAHPEAELVVSLVNQAVEAAFSEHGHGSVRMPPKLYVTIGPGDFRTMPAYLPSAGIAGVKVVNVHPENPSIGLPTVMALLIILDIQTGIPLAILNATSLTDLRTGAAGAVATKYLCPKKSIVLGMIGAGRQAVALARAIAAEKEITTIKVSSRTVSSARQFCTSFPDIDCRVVTPEDACGADVLVTATPSRQPLVRDEWISEGTHINAMGADAPGKEELDPALLGRSRVFVDDLAQAVHSGEINVPVAAGLFHPDLVAGTIGEVVNGARGRLNAEEITIFDSTGLAIQDLAIAALAMKQKGGVELPFP